MEHDDNTSVLVPEITVKDGIESANHIKTGIFRCWGVHTLNTLYMYTVITHFI